MEMVEWRKLRWVQVDLKEISEEAYERLKRSIILNNFCMPFHVWQDGKIIWILDGHHRQIVMTDLERKDKFKIPDLLPAVFVECKDKKGASKLVLIYSSIYADVTDNGLHNFMTFQNLSLDDFKFDIALPKVNLNKFENKFYEDSIMDIPEDRQDVKPFKRTHVLLSFPPESLIKIQKYLDEILKVKEVEYEQASN